LLGGILVLVSNRYIDPIKHLQVILDDSIFTEKERMVVGVVVEVAELT
jgi:hypothetical protein